MKRLPMGLKTSPSAFSRMITLAMSGLTYEKCFVYLDDLIVFGRNLDDHNKNLLDVFERLRQVNLKLNPSKCDFLKKEILYLGHVVTGDGILPDPDKVKIMKEYPVPKNVEEVKRFIAFANYYRKFIPNFSDKVYSLNKLCKKNVPFKWDEQCQKDFELVKQSLLSPPVLQYPNYDETNEFRLQTDASGYALGAILSNSDNRPVAYSSRNLNKAELNYPTVEKELLAIVWAVKYFRPYLYGRKFKILTDHKPLVYLFNIRDPSSRLMKFRMALEEYDFVVEYVRGKDNAAADALSRVKVTSNDEKETHESVKISMNELKEMNESVMNVMTRAQKKKLESTKSNDTIPNNDWIDQPNVLEVNRKPNNSVELCYLSEKELNKIKNEIKKENKVFCYVPNKMKLYINPRSQSQLSRAEFVRDMEIFCKENDIKEIFIVKDENNDIFIEKLIKEIKETHNWTGPQLCVLKNIKRIECKDDKKVILNDFHILPTSGHAGIRRMLNNIKQYYFWPGLENDIRVCQEMRQMSEAKIH
ncbi:hypothetical protein JYU34_010754 [Plutella xylostella]|uniref:RNA-directed DNA polymerase n=1 Tax=Plutella xylostella TaxID=51655 RepID=A0ABQ7QF59_PLUXY|nr:hypothetical protein JYU34_010754 [Plutella xylostella]